jgi:hypothetical protein
VFELGVTSVHVFVSKVVSDHSSPKIVPLAIIVAVPTIELVPSHIDEALQVTVVSQVM